MKITIQVRGDKTIMQKLERLGPSLTVMPAAMTSIGMTLADYYASTGMRDQGRLYDAAWSPLAQSTLKEKEKRYPGAPALVRTGKMAGGFYYSAGSHSVTIDNAVSYYKYHQSTRTPRKRLPRRPMAGMNEGLRRTIAQIIEKDIRRKIDGVGV